MHPAKAARIPDIEAYSEFGKCRPQETDSGIDIPHEEVSVFKPNSHTIDLQNDAAWFSGLTTEFGWPRGCEQRGFYLATRTGDVEPIDRVPPVTSRWSSFVDTVSDMFVLNVLVRAERLIGAGNARQQGLHMLPGLPRAGTTRGLNAVSPGLLCPGKVISVSQDRPQHLISGCIIRVETHDLAQRLRCLSPVFQFVLFTGQAVPDHGVFRLLGEHCCEGFDFRLDHRFVLNRPDSTDPLKLFFGMLRPLRATARDHTSQSPWVICLQTGPWPTLPLSIRSMACRICIATSNSRSSWASLSAGRALSSPNS